MNAPTIKQLEVLKFIADKIELEQLPPTIQEICNHFAFKSTQGARSHLDLLQKKGFIAVTPKISRGIRICR